MKYLQESVVKVWSSMQAKEGKFGENLDTHVVCSPFQEAPPLPHFGVFVLTLGWSLFTLWSFLFLLFG